MNENINEIDVQSKSFSLNELLIMFRKFWLSFVIIIVACTIVGGVSSLILAKPTYTAKASIILQYETSSETVGDMRNAAYYGQQLVPTISDLLNSNSVYLDVKNSNKEHVETNYRKNLKVSSSSDSLVLTISYSTKSGKIYAVETINQVLDSLQNIVNSKDGEGKPRYKLLCGNIAVLDQPSFENDVYNGVSVSNNKIVYVLVGFALGLIIAVVYLVVRFLIDNTIRTRQELESITGFKAIALIEDIAISKKKVKNNE